MKAEEQDSGASSTKRSTQKADQSVDQSNEEMDQKEVNLWSRKGRRPSVCAEVYNPALDDLTDIEHCPKTKEEAEKILKLFDGVFLFRCLDDAQRKVVVEVLTPQPVKKGEIIIVQGDEGNSFYLIESGIFLAFITDHKGHEREVYRYDNTGSFGELALMYNEPRAATVKAVSDGFLWVLSGKNFRRLILQSAYQKRKKYESLLKKVRELEPLNSYQRNVVCDALIPKTVGPNEIIFYEGDVADGMYFVDEGEVLVTVNKGKKGPAMEICRLQPGSYFGELALLTKKPRAATVTSLKQTKLAFLDVESFERLLGPCINLLEQHIDINY